MKSKSPFAIKSPLLAYKSDMTGNYANPEYVPRVNVGAAVGAHAAKTAADVFTTVNEADKGKRKAAADKASGGSNDNRQTVNVHYGGSGTENKTTEPNESLSWSNPFSTLTSKIANETKENYTEPEITAEGTKAYNLLTKEQQSNQDKKWIAMNTKSETRDRLDVYKDGELYKKGDSPFGLIGDTMDPYGQINPGAVPPNQAQNDLGAQPIISADGSQPNARAIDIAAIANPYATPGADFNPQSKMKAESIFGSPMQRQGLMNLGTPLHDAGHGAKQAHTHPSKTTTKMKPDGEYPGARYVKGDLVDQDDLLDKTKLDAHIATQVQSDKKGTFIKEKSDDGPGSDIETSKGFGKKIRLGSMGRSSYTSNMKDQSDPHNFLFQNTPKK